MCMWVHVHVYGYKVCTHTTNKVYVLTKFHNMEQQFNSHSNCAVQVNNNVKGDIIKSYHEKGEKAT